MSAVPTRVPVSDPISTTSTVTPPVSPNPPHRRLWLLLKLFLVPVAVVCLPSLFVTYFFGQRPTPKVASDAAFTGLRESLERAAREGLPETTSTFGTRFESLTIPCAPSEADARMEWFRAIVAKDGGTLTEQATDAAGRHLVVELPGEHWPRFRVAALHPEMSFQPALDPAAANARVFVNVTLAAPAATPAP